MSDRGEYRAIRRVLIDGPDFQALPAHARSTFLFVKLNFGPAGIEVWYHEELVARLVRQSGHDATTIEEALDCLEATSWIRREANVVWIVGQLDNDPHIKVNDRNHRKSVQRHVAGLPRLPIVGAFAEAHPEWFADAEVNGFPIQHRTRAIEGPSQGLRSTEDKPEAEDKHNDNHKKRRDSPAPLAAANGSLPPDAIAFGARFYGNATQERRRAVYDELVATLGPGASFDKGVVRAGTPERLAAKCRAVMDEGVRNPDRAIVVLLRKLADVSDDSPTERDAVGAITTARTEAKHTDQLADTWIREHPILYTELEERSRKRFPGDDPFRAEIRRNWLLSEVMSRARPRPAKVGGAA